MKTIHLVVKGKVQGVFFRASAREKAGALGLSGRVKNTASGDVEIMATGEELLLQKFIQWCHQGPGRAVVDEVVKTEMELQDFAEFSIER